MKIRFPLLVVSPSLEIDISVYNDELVFNIDGDNYKSFCHYNYNGLIGILVLEGRALWNFQNIPQAALWIFYRTWVSNERQLITLYVFGYLLHKTSKLLVVPTF